MAQTRKVCPVLLRNTAAGRTDILVFRHPLAGTQLVKGTIETGESVRQAAIRELFEESGLVATAIADLGSLQMAVAKQEWRFVRCAVAHAPEIWTYWTSDGGGLYFEFAWHPLHRQPDGSWRPIFKGALAFIRQQIEMTEKYLILNKRYIGRLW
ncbi:MAG: NUDIX domain-containing protein [Hyphomicrobiales bacterium]|nr:NUDIX domain-containing protein [Hyphomicrobiales bacterium]